MEEIIRQYSQMGQYVEALKMFAKGMRDYCTQNRHVISVRFFFFWQRCSPGGYHGLIRIEWPAQMYVWWIETTIIVGEWHRVEALTAQAERALAEAEDADLVGFSCILD